MPAPRPTSSRGARLSGLFGRSGLGFLAPALGLLAVVLALIAVGSSSEPSQPATVPVQRGPIAATVTADGSVEAPSELALNIQGFGRLVAVSVDDGDRVRRGQVLARVESLTQAAQLGSARAELSAARTRLAATRGGLTPIEVALRRREADASRVALRNAQRDLAHARRVSAADVEGLYRAVARARVAGEEADLRAAELRLAQERDEVERTRQRYESARARADRTRSEIHDALEQTRGSSSPEHQQNGEIRVRMLENELEGDANDERVAKSELDTAMANVRTYVQEVDRDLVALREARRRLGQAQDELRSGIATARQQVNQARDELATSQAELQTTLARNRVDMQVKARDVATGIADVARAQSLVTDARKALDDTVLRAPANGVVGHVNAHVGELVGSLSPSSPPGAAAGAAPSAPGAPGGDVPIAERGAVAGAGAGQPLMTFAQSGGLQVKVNFAETDAAALHTGDAASVTVDALPKRRFAARVASIDPIETVRSGVVSYEVTLVLERSARELRPGMSATATVRVAEERYALSVPRTAVRSPQGANPSVIVVRPDGRQELRQVATGLQSETRVQILAGVGLGERVLRDVSAPIRAAP